jgi:hypothetical protein
VDPFAWFHDVLSRIRRIPSPSSKNYFQSLLEVMLVQAVEVVQAEIGCGEYGGIPVSPASLRYPHDLGEQHVDLRRRTGDRGA